MARTHAQLVAEGKRLVAAEGDAKWQLGDLAEVTEHGTGSSRSSPTKSALGPRHPALGTGAIAAEWPDRRALPISSTERARWRPWRRIRTPRRCPLDRPRQGRQGDGGRGVKAVWRPADGTNNPSAPSSTTGEDQRPRRRCSPTPRSQRAIVADGPLRVELNQAARVHHRADRRERDVSSASRARAARSCRDRRVSRRDEGHAARCAPRAWWRSTGSAPCPSSTDSQRSQVQREVNWIRENLDLIDGFTSGRRAATLADEVEQFLEREAAR